MAAAVWAVIAWVSANAMLATAIAMSVLSVAMTIAMKPKMPSSARGQAERKQVLRSSTAPVDWVYGHTVKSGLLAFAEEEVGGWLDESTDMDTNQGYVEWLHMVLTIAGHPIDRIVRIWFNDDEIGTYGDLATYELMNDPQTANAFLLANCPSWKTDMIGKGCAHLRVSMKFNQQKFSAGIPNIKAELWGRHVYDPRDQQTKWSDNAALVILDFVRNHPKFKVKDHRIDWEAFKAAANICDEICTRPDGTIEKRYTINGCFDFTERPTDILNRMLDCMAGELTWFGGLIGVMAGAYYGPALVTVESSDIVSNINITPEPSAKDRLNTVSGTFIDPEQNYIETDYPTVVVSEWVTADGEEKKDDLKLPYVTSYYQAQRLANIKLRRNRMGRTLSFTMNLRGYSIFPGSYIHLKVPEAEIDHEFRVIEWEHDPSAGTVTLTVREDGIALWDDAVGKPIDRPPLVNLPTGGPATPSDLQFQVETIGEVVQGVLTWRNSSMTAYTNIAIKRDDEVVYVAQEPRNIHRLQGLAAGDYAAELRAVGMDGGISDKATLAFTVAMPAAVTGVDIRAGNWDITLTPRIATVSTYGTEFEFWYYRLPLTIDQVESTAMRLGSGAQLTHSGLQTDTTHYYWIRAINAYGKGPLFALEARTTRDANSVLDVISGSIGAEDLIAELREPLESTIDMWTAKVGNPDIGQYGGIGLTIEQDGDGVWRTKCIVDAEVFAILDPSGAVGAGSRHPFIVKDGVVYMNKLLLDDAEIANVIAQYINVQDLVAVTITASTIKSSDNGASFQLLPDGTMSCTKATITGSVTATSGTFTGTVNANAGTFNNITIAENCNVLGTIYARRIVGDLYEKAPVDASASTGTMNEGSYFDVYIATLAPADFPRKISVSQYDGGITSIGPSPKYGRFKYTLMIAGSVVSSVYGSDMNGIASQTTEQLPFFIANVSSSSTGQVKIRCEWVKTSTGTISTLSSASVSAKVIIDSFKSGSTITV